MGTTLHRERSTGHLYYPRVRKSVFHWERVAAVCVGFGYVVCVTAGSNILAQARHTHDNLIFKLVDILLLIKLFDILGLLLFLQQVYAVVVILLHLEFFTLSEKLVFHRVFLFF